MLASQNTNDVNKRRGGVPNGCQYQHIRCKVHMTIQKESGSRVFSSVPSGTDTSIMILYAEPKFVWKDDVELMHHCYCRVNTYLALVRHWALQSCPLPRDAEVYVTPLKCRHFKTLCSFVINSLLHSVAFSQRSSSPRLTEDETFNDSDIIHNLINYEDGEEEQDSLKED
ncbi:uncharacterized protein TNCV_3226611 [Trichonephila clavipes]|nr:uncharacterized protein TNCV_3226611 [Trichonephila clavipes]